MSTLPPPVAAALAELSGVAIETRPAQVKKRSRDFYWYSPVLKRVLDGITADAVVTPVGEEEVVRVVAACVRHGGRAQAIMARRCRCAAAS